MKIKFPTAAQPYVMNELYIWYRSRSFKLLVKIPCNPLFRLLYTEVVLNKYNKRSVFGVSRVEMQTKMHKVDELPMSGERSLTFRAKALTALLWNNTSNK